MPKKTTSNPGLAIKDRLSVKLGLLFFFTFCAVFISGLVIDVFQSVLEKRNEDELQGQPAVVAFDPKIESELSKVMSFAPPQNTEEIKDPFSDRSGISNNGTPIVTATPAANQTQPGNPGAIRTGTTTTNPPKSNTQVTNITTVPATNPVVISIQEATLARIRYREELISVGKDPGPESLVYAIDDLHPVGVVSGGSGGQEIMFYSEVADRTLSFPVGTQFFDGSLVELKPEGVIFGLSDVNRTLRLKIWEHNIKSKSSGNLSVLSTTILTTAPALSTADNN